MLLAERPARATLVALAVWGMAAGCSGASMFRQEYEYEEVLFLSLDGSATVDINASVAALAALHGARLDPDPRARLDREYLRGFFGAPGARVSISLGRRDGRRVVHARIRVDDLTTLSRIAPLARSEYHLDRRADILIFRQTVGRPAGPELRRDAWSGDEMVAFRLQLPSEILLHNAPSGEIERGNILEWEQPLVERLAGVPVDIEVQLASTSILARTLLLFGATVGAAAAAVVIFLWWISRRRPGAEELAARDSQRSA